MHVNIKKTFTVKYISSVQKNQSPTTGEMLFRNEWKQRKWLLNGNQPLLIMLGAVVVFFSSSSFFQSNRQKQYVIWRNQSSILPECSLWLWYFDLYTLLPNTFTSAFSCSDLDLQIGGSSPRSCTFCAGMSTRWNVDVCGPRAHKVEIKSGKFAEMLTLVVFGFHSVCRA